MAVKVARNLCRQNHRCPAVRSCPVDALRQMGYAALTINKDACIDCGTCVRVCPTNALRS